LRLRQGVILLVGASVIALAIGASPTGFYWTPLALGLVYLAAALSRGPQGSYWATAVVAGSTRCGRNEEVRSSKCSPP